MRISDWSSDVCASDLRGLFSKLPEWEENPPRPAPRSVSLQPDAVVARLEQLTGAEAEARPGQRAYAAAAAEIFRPRAHRDQPNMLLAEEGTGIGKTLGYLATARSEQRRGGKGGVSTSRSRWSPVP